MCVCVYVRVHTLRTYVCMHVCVCVCVFVCVRAHVQATLDFRTPCSFIHFTFSPLIRLSYAEFGISCASNEQTFRAVAQ
jgi:hypothetical protein